MRKTNYRSGRLTAEMEMNAILALAEMGKKEKSNRIKDVSPDLEKSKHARSVEDDPRDSKGSAAVVKERAKAEQNTELSASNICSSSHGHRLKKDMTEEEKEAKRIRRVLANRQSARQTILRRQALRDELSKKVADLSLDNKNMKMEKELLSKQCISLKNRNKQLKEQFLTLQMAKTMKCEDVESEMPTSPSTELSLVPSSKPSSSARYLSSPWYVDLPETIEDMTSDNIELEEKPDVPVAENPETTLVQPPRHRFVDPVAAAAARKRRKELKKLKLLNARHISMRSS